MSRTITKGNIDALRQGYNQLKEHPCNSCYNEDCDICHDAKRWMRERPMFIFSPLLKQVVEEFIQNHSPEESVKNGM